MASELIDMIYAGGDNGDGEKKGKKVSNFHFMFNPNLSPSTWAAWTEIEKFTFVKALDSACKKLEESIKEFIKTKSPKDKARTNIKKFECNVEVGKRNAFIHIDGFIEFDSYCHLKYPEIQEMFNSYISPFNGQRGIFYAKPYDDTKKIIESYSRKDGMPLVSYEKS